MKSKKLYILGGMLFITAVLLLLTMMDLSDGQTIAAQEVSLRADAEDLSLADMINTVENRKRPSDDEMSSGFVGSENSYGPTNREDDPEAIARVQAAIRQSKENIYAGIQQIEAERNGTPESEVAPEVLPARSPSKKSADASAKRNKKEVEQEEVDTVEAVKEVVKPSPFHSIRLVTSSNRNAIKAYVHSEQVVMDGSTLKMRLGEDAYTDNDVLIPKNSPVYGIVTGIDGERVNVKITHINLNGNILPFEKEVYSKDALLGIYVPGNPKAETTKDVTGGALDGLPTSGIPGVDATAQIASVVATSAANAGKQAITKNVKKIKVTIKTNYEIFLRPEENK